MMKQKELNDFKRQYFDPLKPRRSQGHIVFDGNSSKEHRKLVADICAWAHNSKLTFFTRVFVKGNEIVDIIIPELSFPFIEVRHTEKEKEKVYVTEYDGIRQFIDTDDYFKLM